MTVGTTDPTGRVFISYRRTCLDDVDRLAHALRAHGVPTWQDVRDLGPHSTEAEIRQVLADPATSGAVIWISPDLTSSAFIGEIEVPAIVERVNRDDGFFAQLVAVGGLDRAEAGELASRHLGVTNLGRWNVWSVDSMPVDLSDAMAVARRVLERRLACVSRSLAPGEALTLTLRTGPRGGEPGRALQLDWSEQFGGGKFLAAGVWERELRPALRAVREALDVHGHGRPVEARGQARLPAAAALGYALRDTSGIALTWTQTHLTVPSTWSLAVPPEDSGVTIRLESDDPASGAVAVLIATRQAVEPRFGEIRRDLLPRLRGVIHVEWPAGLEGATMTPAQGVDIALQVQQALRRARKEWRLPGGGGLHLFMACPAGLAVLVGQLLNTWAPITVYDESDGPYAPALTIEDL